MFRSIVSIVTIVVVISFTTSVQAQNNKNAAEKLHGTWIVVGAEYDGPEGKCDLKKGEKLVFDGNRFKFESKLYHEEGTFTTEGDKKTKEINLVDAKDRVCEGIYELKGEELELCYAHKGRPIEFKSTKGVMLIKLKR